MEYLVWVGPRDSDVQFCKCFQDKICYFSQANPMPQRKANIYGTPFLEFVKKRMLDILSYHSNAKFIFYNPKIAYSLDKYLQKYVICLNDKNILDILSNKIYTRYWFGAYVPVLPSILLESRGLSFNEFRDKLGEADEYIVQKNISSGGFGTYYVTRENGMLAFLQKAYNELLIVSPYIKNSVSININAIIYDSGRKVFAPSIQIIENNGNRLLYHGADYTAAKDLPENIHKMLQEYSDDVLRHIQRLGYRGIIGLDFILTNNHIYFQEVNPRYQASSFLIDIALNNYGFPSMTEMNMHAFSSGIAEKENFYNLITVYSFYKYLYTKNAKHLYHIEKSFRNNPYVFYFCADGWDCELEVDEDAYCYAVVFSTNIISLNFDGSYNMYSNISGEEKYLHDNIESPIGLKIALLNQGCALDEEVIDFLSKQGIVKKAAFSSIDFQLSNGLYINAPVGLKFTDFSPFSIKVASNKKPALYYYEQQISEIDLEMQPDWNDITTRNNVAYGRIAYLSTDRLRFKHESVCAFKKQGLGCHFCSIPVNTNTFTLDDINEVAKELLRKPTFRHILLGGGSGNPEEEYQKIIEISKTIHGIDPEIPIYLMCLPPTKTEILEQYKNVGISEIAFNIEIWNRELAKEIMPGKGAIPLDTYMTALKESTILWGTTGNVRTALIIGLDKTESLLEGVQLLCQNGIQPMISVFRPMPNTKLRSLAPPSNSELLSFYNSAQKICSKYHLQLGPTCDACKNNMLAI